MKTVIASGIVIASEATWRSRAAASVLHLWVASLTVERVALADERRRGKATPCALMPHSLQLARDGRLRLGIRAAGGGEWISCSC